MMSNPDQIMMTSTQDPSCRTYRMEMATSIQTWSMHWLRSMLFRTWFEMDQARNTTACNFALIGEELLAPHGEKLAISEPGDKATCACECQIVVPKKM